MCKRYFFEICLAKQIEKRIFQHIVQNVSQFIVPREKLEKKTDHDTAEKYGTVLNFSIVVYN